MLKNVNMCAQSFAVLFDMLRRRLGEKQVAISAFPEITFSVDSRLERDAFELSARAKACRVDGHDECAVFAGAGELLMRCAFDGSGGFSVPDIDFRFVPERPVRGIYFATHFNNFYHAAPIGEVLWQVEDAAMRGANAIAVWYDMHHYASVDEPDSVLMISRLKSILAHARAIGMKTCMTMIINEAFQGTKEEIKAQWRPQGRYFAELDGHYHVEICPSKPGGIEEIVRQRKNVLSKFTDIKPDYVICWPYDQGGCTCKMCESWAANGFLRLIPYFRQAVEEDMPASRIIVSTWYFDKFIKGEWAEFYERASAGELNWAEYLMGFFPDGEIPGCIRENGMPGGKKMLSFPEISMYGAMPWGGFGANPIPDFLQRTNGSSEGLYDGQFCYSEGIFEDINKWAMLAYCSGRNKNAREAIERYARFEFCAPDAAGIAQLLCDLEETLPRDRLKDGRFVIKMPEKVEAILEKACEIDAALPQSVRDGWRWRIVLLRAKIDAELKGNDYRVSIKCDEYMKELIVLYYAQNASRAVRPPCNSNFT